jgi:uncharacterized membrane protein YfcA
VVGDDRTERANDVRGPVALLLDAVTGPAPALGAAWIAAFALIVFYEPFLATLMALGLSGAFIAGLVGVGGAIVVVPLLLYVPPLLGFQTLDIHAVAGITVVQVAVAGLVGMLPHRKHGYVSVPLVASLGIAMMAASLASATMSGWIEAHWLTAVFSVLAAAAAILMLAGPREAIIDGGAGDVTFSKGRAILLGASVGTLVGMVGAGGGFLLVPLMIHALGIPVRVAVGSSLAVVALGGVAGTAGKALTGQIAWPYALALVAGALPGAMFGGLVSARVSASALARLLGIVIALVAARMWWDLLWG